MTLPRPCQAVGNGPVNPHAAVTELTGRPVRPACADCMLWSAEQGLAAAVAGRGIGVPENGARTDEKAAWPGYQAALALESSVSAIGCASSIRRRLSPGRLPPKTG